MSNVHGISYMSMSQQSHKFQYVIFILYIAARSNSKLSTELVRLNSG